MTAVIRLVCWADGRPTGLDGQYLVSWTQKPDDGTLKVTAAVNPADAFQFPTAAEALAAWREQSVDRPLRYDGKPNRPLTALTVEVLSLDTALEGSS